MATQATDRPEASLLIDRLRGARLAAWNDHGEICVWHGGYSFNVYDTARGWAEVDHFTSGQLAGLTDYDSPEAYGYAKARMRSEGFTVIE